jgi:VWFA-related protein
MKSSRCALILAVLALPAAAQQKPAAPPLFPSAVDFVTVDVVVTDKSGQPVTGLKAEDFTVIEDKVPQSVTSFEAVELPLLASATPAPTPAVSTNIGVKESRTNRSFVVFFDDMHLSPLQASRAKAAVNEFLNKGTREGDRVSLVASGGGAWWTARMESGRPQLIDLLKRLDGRYIRPPSMMDQMSAWEALRIHIYHDSQVADKVYRRFQSMGVHMQQDQTAEDRQPADFDPYVTMKALETYEESRRRNTITLEILERAVLSMSQTKGRKSLILVSEGFIYDMNLDQFKRVLHSARTANVAIYFLDTRGLSALPDTFSAEFGPPTDPRDIGSNFLDTLMESEGSENLADESGGFTVKNTNDLSAGIQKIANESRAYYLLGYAPANTARDGKWRKIEVKVNRKGVNIRSRKGYFAPLEGSGSALTAARQQDGVDQAFQAALDAPNDIDGLPLRMTTYVLGETILGKATSAIVADVDVGSLSFEQKDGRFNDTLEFLLVAAHRETGEYYRYDQKIEMSFRPETREKYLVSWFPIMRDFELPPGGYQAKIVVRDQNSGRVGTVSHEFTVPDLSAWRVSSLILTDTLAPRAAGEQPTRPVALARRTFKPEGVLYGSFEVFGAAKEKGTLLPRVAAGYVVRTKEDGNVVVRQTPTTITTTPQGMVTRMFGFRVDGFRPGRYEVVLTVKDEVGGTTKELKEDFFLEGASAAPAASN